MYYFGLIHIIFAYYLFEKALSIICYNLGLALVSHIMQGVQRVIILYPICSPTEVLKFETIYENWRNMIEQENKI